MATNYTADSNSEIAALYEDAAASGTVNDSSSNNNDGTVNTSTGITQGVTGKFDLGIDCNNGNNAKYTFPAQAANNNLANLSVCIYMKNGTYGTAGAQGDKSCIVNKGYRSGALSFQTTNQLRWTEHFGGGTVTWNTTNGSCVADGTTWQHYAVTYGDRSTSSPTVDPIIYIDGVAQTVTETSGPPFLTRDDDSGNAVMLAQDSVDSGESDSTHDEFLWYNGILTSTQVNEIKDNGIDGTHGAGTTKAVSALTVSTNLPTSLRKVSELSSAQIVTSTVNAIGKKVAGLVGSQNLNATLPTHLGQAIQITTVVVGAITLRSTLGGMTTTYQPIVIRSETTGTDTSDVTTGEFDVTKPSSVQNGDLLIVIIGKTAVVTGSSVAPPAGWVLGSELRTSTGNDVYGGIFYKRINNAASEPAVYVFDSNDTSESISYWIGSLSGVDLDNPQDVVFSGAGTWANLQNDTSPNLPAVTTVTPGAFALGAWVVSTDTATTQPGGSWADRANDINDDLNVVSQTFSVVGSTGTPELTDVGSLEETQVGMFVFRPALAVAAETVVSNLPPSFNLNVSLQQLIGDKTVTVSPVILTSSLQSSSRLINKQVGAQVINANQPESTVAIGGAAVIFEAQTLTINSSLITPTPAVNKTDSAQVITTNQPVVSTQVSISQTVVASALTINFIQPTVTFSITENKTVLANALTINANQPLAAVSITADKTVLVNAVTLNANQPTTTASVSSSSTLVVSALTILTSLSTASFSSSTNTTVIVDALVINSYLQESSKYVNRLLLDARRLTSALGSVTEEVSTDLSPFQIISSMPDVTISGVTSQTVEVEALTINSNLNNHEKTINRNLLDARRLTSAFGAANKGVKPGLSDFQIIASLPSVTIDVLSDDTTVLVDALTMQLILLEFGVTPSRVVKIFSKHQSTRSSTNRIKDFRLTKHSQPRRTTSLYAEVDA